MAAARPLWSERSSIGPRLEVTGDSGDTTRLIALLPGGHLPLQRKFDGSKFAQFRELPIRHRNRQILPLVGAGDAANVLEQRAGVRVKTCDRVGGRSTRFTIDHQKALGEVEPAFHVVLWQNMGRQRRAVSGA